MSASELKFLVDVGVGAKVEEHLLDNNYDLKTVRSIDQRMPDQEIIRLAALEKRIIVTMDKDFGALVYRLRKPAAGIVLIRMAVEQRQSKWLRLKKLIDKYADRLPGHFVVINIDKFRFRPLLLESPSP